MSLFYLYTLLCAVGKRSVGVARVRWHVGSSCEEATPRRGFPNCIQRCNAIC